MVAPQAAPGVADLSYVFLIFFITLGPLKTIPAFAGLTAAMPAGERRMLAFKGVLTATGIVLFVAFGAAALREKWQISWAALSIAAGLMLLLAALRTMSSVFAPGQEPAHGPLPATAKGLVLTPVAVPTIVTAYGVAAILLFLAGHPGDNHFRLGVVAMLLTNMALNLVCMLFALPIAKAVTPAGWRLLGWIFAILQAALAIEVILAPARVLLGVPYPGV